MIGKLIILGTPIGNLQDFSPRAQATLRIADFIAAEDTRVTRKLLNYFEISKPLISYFEHNKCARQSVIIDRILNGEICVLVSDAGMPAISDPGEELVRACAERAIPLEVVPGPCALTAAVAVCGLPAGRFTFEGFLSVNKKARKEHLNELKNETRTMVFYEAPHKLKRTLNDFWETFGDRKITIVREITKIHEEIIYTTLKDAADLYIDKKPKGEIVLVLEGREDKGKENSYSMEQAILKAQNLLQQNFSKSEAAKIISRETKLKKSDIYRALL